MSDDIDDGTGRPDGYVTPDGHLEVRDGHYHETALGRHDRWLRQCPDLFEKYQCAQEDLRLAGEVGTACGGDLLRFKRALVGVMNALDVHMPPEGTGLLREVREIAATVGYPWGESSDEHPALSEERCEHGPVRPCRDCAAHGQEVARLMSHLGKALERLTVLFYVLTRDGALSFDDVYEVMASHLPEGVSPVFSDACRAEEAEAAAVRIMMGARRCKQR